MSPRWAAKTDTTHAAIRDALRDCGCLVIDTSHASGFVDLVVLRRPGWTVHLVECKTPQSKAGRIDKTKGQTDLEAQGWPIVYLKSVDEAVQWLSAPAR